MSLSAQEIEQIVVRVMEQILTPDTSAHPPRSPAFEKSRASSPEHAIPFFPEPVITQELLAGTANGAQRIRIAPRAILTPSARDFLRSRGIDCVREAANPQTSRRVKWQAVIARSTPQVQAVIESLRAEGESLESRLLGLPVEAAQHAMSAICRGEAAGLAVFTTEPELVACLANRNPTVRAIALGESQAFADALRSVRPNVLAINPVGKSFYELRNVLRTFTSLNPES